MRRHCTPHELRTIYSLSDLCDFHTAMAEWDEMQRLATEKPNDHR